MATKRKPARAGQDDSEKNNTVSRRLTRSQKNRVLGGVAGGLGEYLGIDPAILRILFVLMTVFGGSGIILYLVLWLTMPSSSSLQDVGTETIRENAEEMKTAARNVLHISPQSRLHQTMGFFLVFIGGWWLLSNMGIFRMMHFEKFWPLLLILIGISLVLR